MSALQLMAVNYDDDSTFLDDRGGEPVYAGLQQNTPNHQR
jgi:hypothetical protein